MGAALGPEVGMEVTFHGPWLTYRPGGYPSLDPFCPPTSSLTSWASSPEQRHISGFPGVFFQTEGQAFLRLRTGALGTLDTEKVSYIASLFLAELAVVLMLKDSILLMMCHISPQGFPTCTEKLTVVWALADDTKGGKWFAMFPPTPDDKVQ